LFQWDNTIKIKLSELFEYRADTISSKCNLFSPAKDFALFALNNNHSIIQSHTGVK
jgi:hypothetical protein